MAPRLFIASLVEGSSRLKACFGLVAIGVIATLSSGSIAQPDPLFEAKQARDAYVRTFRETGRIDPALLAASVPALEALAAASDGATRAKALYELGTIERMTNHFSHAAVTLAEAADLAAAS